MVKTSTRAKSQSDRVKLGRRFKLGGIRGEDDPLLSAAFYETPDYEEMVDRDLPSAFVIGRTGAGKSAAFHQLHQTNPDNVILLNPVDLALPHISNVEIIRDLMDRGFNLEPFFRPLWERIFVTEIIHHRYKNKDAEARQRFLERIMSRLRSNPAERARKRSLELLEEMKDDFFCPTEERVQRNVETLRELIQADSGFTAKMGATAGIVNAELGGSFGGNGTAERTIEMSTESRDRIQRIINQSELPRLKEMLTIIKEHVLDSSQNFTYILIDDLDQYWVDDSIRLMLLRCLFHAVMDISAQVPNLKILVALRTNIFSQLDYGSQKFGPQEEKIKDMILHMRWTKEDLIGVLNERVRVASEKQGILPALSLDAILPNPNSSRDPIESIIRLTLMRPRDAIQFLSIAVELAEGRPKLNYEHISVAEDAYSRDRLEALRDEWKDPYFHIDKVLEKFRRKPTVLSWDELMPILDLIAGDVCYSASFKGGAWLEPRCAAIYQSSFMSTEHVHYYPLIQVFYEIGFLGISAPAGRKEGAGEVYRIAMYCQGTGEHLSDEQLGDEVRFVVHPAFHRALDMPQRWINPN